MHENGNHRFDWSFGAFLSDSWDGHLHGGLQVRMASFEPPQWAFSQTHPQQAQ